MRGRDFGILFVAAVAAFVSLQGQDAFAARRIFTVDIDPSHYKNHHTPAANEQIPQPIVADVDGDGRNEFIVVTREPKIVIYDTASPVANKNSKSGGKSPSSHLVVKAEATLLSKARIRSARQPVAFAVGKLTKDAGELHIVVLTHDWSVLCFDSSLKLIWEQHPVKRKMSDVFHREAAIIISPTNVRAADKGLVIVGASHDLVNYDRYFKRAAKLDRKTHRHHEKYRNHKREKSANHKIRRQLIEAILRGHGGVDQNSLAKAAAARQARIEYKKEREVEDLKHFSLYAMDGRTGAIRWKQENKDWSLQERHMDKTVPLHNFHLDLHSETKHAGEVDWRQYRVSMLKALPHAWNRKEDTHFEIAHFSKRNNKASVAEDEARNAALHAREVGLFEAAPLPSSKTLWNQEVIAAAKSADEKQLPNVVIAHTQRGIEVVHLYTGRTLSQLPLPPHILHCDANHDGAIDRIEAVVVSDGEMAIHEGGHEAMGDPPSCYGWVTTGYPPSHAVFNKTICAGSWNSIGTMIAKMQWQTRQATKRHSKSREEQEEEQNEASYELHAALPALVARAKHREAVISRSMTTHDIVFAVSDGTISSYSPNGVLNWQMITTAYWVSPSLVTEAEEAGKTAREEERHLIEVEPYAQVLPFPRESEKSSNSEEFVLAIGSHNAVLLGHDGYALTHFQLLDVPIAPAIVTDVDSDGFSDIVIVTRTGYHGYSLSAKQGGHLLSMLLGGVLVLLGGMFAFAAMTVSGGETKAVGGGGLGGRGFGVGAGGIGGARRIKKERATD